MIFFSLIYFGIEYYFQIYFFRREDTAIAEPPELPPAMQKSPGFKAKRCIGVLENFMDLLISFE
jgi:hypothetical protein